MVRQANEQKIVNNVAANRFELREDGHLSVLTYTKAGDTIVYRHTAVPRALRGHGVAARLAAHALEYARANGLTVIPLCPYVLEYITQHPEYANLVLPRARWAEVLDAN